MQDTYSIRELMARYKRAKSTIFRMMAAEGFPRGGHGKGGSRTTISGKAVYAWELVHMPWLHELADDEAKTKMEEDERWNGPNGIRTRYEAELAKGIKKDEKATPPAGWDEVRRKEKERLGSLREKIKARRSK